MIAARERKFGLVLSLRRKPAGTWGQLSEPIKPGDTLVKMRAMSVLHGIECRDGDRFPLLTPAEARDVIAWNERIRKL